MTNHVTSCLSTHAKYLSLNKLLVVDLLTCFYNSQSSHNGLASPFERIKKSFSTLCFPFWPRLSTIHPVYCKRSGPVFPPFILYVVKDLALSPLPQALRLPFQALYLYLLPLLGPLETMTSSKSL